MAKLSILASGSGGNAALLTTESTHILIDAGLSIKQLRSRLALIGEDLERVDALLLTHEHGDHAASVPALSKSVRFGGKILMSRGTCAAIDEKDRGSLRNDSLSLVEPGFAYQIGDVTVAPLSVPHDAAQPLGFRLDVKDGPSVGFVIDLGHIPPDLSDSLAMVDVLMIEANHDLDMLKVGPYARELKMRVRHPMGHLSNTDLCEYIESGPFPKVRELLVGHLSSACNDPRLVRLEVGNALKRAGRAPGVSIASQNEPVTVSL